MGSISKKQKKNLKFVMSNRVTKRVMGKKWVEKIEEWINNSCGWELTNKIYLVLAAKPSLCRYVREFKKEFSKLILIENSVWINPSSDWKLGFGLVWINSDFWLRLNRIRSGRFFTVFWIGSEWFALARIQISEWIRIVLIGSGWLLPRR